MLLGVAFSAVGANAQISDDSVETSCVTADFGGQQLQIGVADRTTSVAVALPAGTVTIPSARATDSYPNRVNVTQPSEKYEVEFLSASGAIIAVSAPTADVPDFVEFGEWIGSLGSVELSEPAVAVRAHHRPDLPFDGQPDSLQASEVTLCFEVTPDGPSVDPVCGDEGVTTNADGTPCNPVCGDEGVTTNADGTPCNPVCGDEGVTVDADGTPCNPVPTTTVDEEVAGPTTTVDEEVAGPTTSTTAAPTTAAPTTAAPTTAAPTTAVPTTVAEEVAGPSESTLPVTGSNSAFLLALGAAMLLAGGGLLAADRRLS